MSRAELAALAAQPRACRSWKRAAGAAIIGAVVFIAYLFIDPDRAWRAFHVNWLFFALISVGGRDDRLPCSASRRRAGRVT